MEKLSLNIGWQFAKLPDQTIEEPVNSAAAYQTVDIPHTWYENGNAYKGVVVYRKVLNLSCESMQRIFLNFQAADRWCKVYVNGCYVGEHKGGYSAFTFEITEYCSKNGENELLIFLDNRSGDEISPLVGDFTVFGGLYRDVDLIVTGLCCFDRTYYGTSGVIVRPSLIDGEGRVGVDVHLLGADEKASVLWQVYSPDGKLVAEQTSIGVEPVELEIHDPVFWNGKLSPMLYRLRALLRYDSEIVDEVDIPFGFRTVSVDSENGFFLNGSHVRIHGVAKHQDFGGVFNAADSAHRMQDMDDILDIGANGVRLSHYQHHSQMYDLCDQNGLIVWAEIPMLRLDTNPKVFDNACSQMTELILQNTHHPCICFWGLQNEIAMFGESEYMYEKIGELNRLVKSLDNTRITACANMNAVKNDSTMNRLTDAVGYNIYFGWYYGDMEDNRHFVENFHQDNPSIPLGITEYGVDCNLAYHSDTPKVKDYSEDYQALYHETVYPIFLSKKYLWGTFIWNLYDFSSEIRDEGGVKYVNSKGLISYDRKIRKDAFYYYKAQWSQEPFVKIAQERYVNRMMPVASFKVYSNQEKATLVVNGAEYISQSLNGVFRFDNIPIQKGENVVRASIGSHADEVIFCGVEEPDASYTFVDSNPGINVKNWFTDIVEEEKLFPKGRLSIRDGSDTLLQNDEAMAILEEFSPKLASQMRERGGSMPLERILRYMKDEFPDERCKELNARLITIER